MYQRYKERFGTAGVVLGVIALILALGGTALAASKLNGTQKKEVEKIAKKYAGKNGTNGTNGAPGAKGDPGAAGSSGAPGANGKSVVTGTLAAGQGGCTEGGVSVEVEGSGTTKSVCNGKKGTNGTNGAPGAPGSPWTAGGTLPPAETETGSWYTTIDTPSETVPGHSTGSAALSFPIPLAGEISGGKTIYVDQGETPPIDCSDGVTPEPGPEHPEADPGFICVFAGNKLPDAFEVDPGPPPVFVPYVEINKSAGTTFQTPGASTAGAVVTVYGLTADEGKAFWGTFAVTAPAPGP